jgi:signal transduction histidine kinase/DNA-binding response OmpR family regulator
MPVEVKVLFASNDEQLLQALSTDLAAAGHSVLTTSGEASALQLYTQEYPDLVLADVHPPGSDGFAVLEAIRDYDPAADVVVLTAPGDMEMVIAALRAGAVDVIPKPVETADLATVLHHAGDRITLKRELRQAKEARDHTAAKALRDAQDAREHKRLERHMEAVYELGWSQTLLHDEATIIQRALEITAQVIDFEFASFSLVDQSAHELLHRYYLHEGILKTMAHRLPLDSPSGITAAVARGGYALNIPDVEQDPRYLCCIDAPGLFKSELCVPMKIGERISGVLNVESVQLNHFTPADQKLLQTLANQTAVALENAHLYTQTQRNARELAALNSATHALASNLDLNTVLQQTMIHINTLLEAEDASVLLYDAENNDLVFAAVATSTAFPILFGQHVALDSGIAGWIARNRQPVQVNNAQEDPRFYSGIDTITAVTTRSLLAVPLITKDRVIGVIEVINKVNGVFDNHDLELLQALASSAAIAIDNAHLYQELIDQLQMLRKAQAQLIQSEKMAALGRLIASISHEINNPLQSIQGCLTLAKEELEGDIRPAKLGRYLDVAEDEIERIAIIVRRVRDFYRPSSQEQALIDLHQTLESVLELAGKQLQHSEVTAERIWLPNLPQVTANSAHLKQVFLNLVLNAIDAMPNGGTLSIRTMLNPTTVAIEFSDTGVGMSAETQARLFEPFFTTKPHGSGLGLSISYGIIEAHHGRIMVTSELGKGTTVTILLPLETS